jgi:hypothetical protein
LHVFCHHKCALTPSAERWKVLDCSVLHQHGYPRRIIRHPHRKTHRTCGNFWRSKRRRRGSQTQHRRLRMRWNLEVEEVLVQPHRLAPRANHRGPGRLQPSVLRDRRLFVPTSCSLGPCFCERDIRFLFHGFELTPTNKLERAHCGCAFFFVEPYVCVYALCSFCIYRATKHRVHTTLMHAGQFISFLICRESPCRQQERTTAFSSYSCCSCCCC